MRRVLLIDSKQTLFLDIALRAMEAGHEVKWFYPVTEKNKFVGKGLCPRVDNWREWMRWADVVLLADNTLYLREIDSWRARENIKVIGPTSASAAFELDRNLGQKILKKAGIDVIPYREFSDYDAAIAYVKKEDRRFVSKPCGDEPDKSLSYVAKSPADLVYMLTRWKKAKKLKSSFILQDFIGGTEMAVGAWYGPGGFNEGWTENFEFKKLMPGDIGVNTGEMGTVLRVVKKSKLASDVLSPLEDVLEETGHTGYVDTNCIIDDQGNPWPLELTMRKGWPLFNIQQQLVKGDPISWMLELAEGRDARNWTLNETALGVVMAIGDFPHSHLTQKEVVGVPIYGVEKASDNVHLCYAMKDNAPQQIDGKVIDAPMTVTAGDYVLVVAATGKTISEAQRRTYSTVKKIEMPSSPIYRTDIGKRLAKCLPNIQSHGYATNWQY